MKSREERRASLDVVLAAIQGQGQSGRPGWPQGWHGIRTRVSVSVRVRVSVAPSPPVASASFPGDGGPVDDGSHEQVEGHDLRSTQKALRGVARRLYPALQPDRVELRQLVQKRRGGPSDASDRGAARRQSSHPAAAECVQRREPHDGASERETPKWWRSGSGVALAGRKARTLDFFIKDVLPSLQTCTVVVANFESSFRQTIIEVLGLRCLLRRVRALPPEPLPGYRIILSMRFLREFCRVSRAGILQGFLCA